MRLKTAAAAQTRTIDGACMNVVLSWSGYAHHLTGYPHSSLLVECSNRADPSQCCTEQSPLPLPHRQHPRPPTGASPHAHYNKNEAGAAPAGNPDLVHPGEARSVTRPAANRRQRSNRVSIPDASTDAHGGLEDEDRPHDAHDVGNPVRHRTEGRQHEEDVGRDL